jgi:amino acid efflux transporter
MSFIGWEAIAPMTSRLQNPARQLPRIIGAAFAITALIYLALAAATIGALGPHAGSAVPLADLLRVAVGPAGRVVAAVLAVALTLAAVNAYVTGAGELAAQLRTKPRSNDRSLQLAIAVVGTVALSAAAAGVVDTAQLVAVPTALFLTVYLGCMVSAARALRGPARACAVVATPAVVAVLAFSGRGLIVAALVVAAAYLSGSHEIRRIGSKMMRNPLLMPDGRLGSVSRTAQSAECGARS